MADPPKKSKPTSESPIPKSFQQRDTQGSVNDRASLSSIRDVKIKDAPSRRIAIRLLISTMRFELAMLATVLVYCVLVFANLAIDDPEVSDMIDEGDLNRLHKAFLYIDLIFLIFFCMEIAIKMYAFGSIAYLKDLFNLTDAIIVWGSFIITCVAIHMDQTNSTLLRSMPILRVVKVVRLVRVVLAMTRIQRSRDRYRRTKMCGIGAPVDRVFEMIEELKLKVKEEDDEKTLAWTMELIAKEQLYTGSFVSQQNNHLMSADMTDWVRSNLQVKNAVPPAARDPRSSPPLPFPITASRPPHPPLPILCPHPRDPPHRFAHHASRPPPHPPAPPARRCTSTVRRSATRTRPSRCAARRRRRAAGERSRSPRATPPRARRAATPTSAR